MPGLTRCAPAKLNLTLEVLGKRPDGYHEVRSVMQAVSLCDRIDFASSDGISFRCQMQGWDSEKTLVKKAALLMKDECGTTAGVSITVDKKIPLSAGLGGDSSDAAVVLTGLNDFWRCGLTEERLKFLASQLGSDLPFFVRGGTALSQGRGEIISALPPPAPLWFVIAVPAFASPQGKTALMYSMLKPSDYSSGSRTRQLVGILESGSPIGDEGVFNVFERVSFDMFPELNAARREMIAAGAASVHLAGAGPALFSMHSSSGEAWSVAKKLETLRHFVACTAASREGCGEL